MDESIAQYLVTQQAPLKDALQAIGVESKAIRFVAQEIGEDPYARRIFGDCADEPSGRLSFYVGKIDLSDVERLSIDSRRDLMILPATWSAGVIGSPCWE